MVSDMMIPISQRHVSWSQLWQAQACEWRWALRNIDRVQSIRRYRAPEAGSAIHVGVAAGLKGDKIGEAVCGWADEQIHQMEHWEKTGFETEEDQAMVNELVGPTILIVDRFLEWLRPDENWKTTLHPNTGEPLIETAFMCQLKPFAGFLGVVDWVATEKKTGLTYVIDWKSRLSMTPPEAEDTNLQKAAYQWMLAENGIPTDGSKICQIWREPMKVPKQNQNGTTSRAKIRTTWNTYRDELLVRGQNPMDYDEMMEKLNPIEDFYRWSTSNRTKVEVEATWNNVVKHRASRIWEMLDRVEESHDMWLPPKRALGSAECTRCWARETCLELLRGRDMEDAIMSGGLVIRPLTTLPTDLKPPDDEAFEAEANVD